MKITLVALLFAASTFAQASPVFAQSSCGPENVSFRVRLDRSNPALPQPVPGQATIYFIHEADSLRTFGYPTTMIGMDGGWVGANKSSYFSVSVGPGEHHVCAAFKYGMAHGEQYLHFTAEAGRAYYFLTRLEQVPGNLILVFNPIDSDEGNSLIASLPLSVSTPKK